MRTKKNLSGLEVGRLKVIKEDIKLNQKSKQTFWLCRCQCGIEKIIRYSHLTDKNRKIQSCGCLIKDKAWRGYKEISGKYFSSLKRGAEKRGLEFSVTIEEIWNLFLSQNKKCALLGIELYFKSSGSKYSRAIAPIEQTASLDRIDSRKGYISGNVQWIHKKLQFMKSDMNDQDFIELCRKVVDYADSKIE